MKNYVIDCKRNFLDALLHKKKICIIDYCNDGKSMFKKITSKTLLKKVKIKSEYQHDNSNLRIILATVNEKDAAQIQSIAKEIKNFAYKDSKEEYLKLFKLLGGE